MKEAQSDTDKIEEYYHPTWLSIQRDFQDRRILEAEQFNELLSTHIQADAETWTCDAYGWSFEFADCNVFVDNDGAGNFVVHASSDSMSRRYLDGMRAMLRGILSAQDELNWTPKDLLVTLLQLVEEAVAWTQLWHHQSMIHTTSVKDPKSGVRNTVLNNFALKKPITIGRQGFDARSFQNYQSVMDNAYGVNIRTIEDTAIDLLGTTIDKICSGIDSAYRILHVEPVFRDDLVYQFKLKQNHILRELLSLNYSDLRKSVSPHTIRPGSSEDTRQRLAEELSQSSVTFHGAPRHCVESIVRYGFIIPGEEIGNTGKELQVRCGSTYGRGVYSSPDSTFASHYLSYQAGSQTKLLRPCDVPGMRLLVCATLMGRTVLGSRKLGEKSTPLFGDRFHSRVSPDCLQYIVFDSAQIIPCYVLHLDYGAEHARAEYDMLAADPSEYFQRRKGKHKSRQDDEWTQWYNSEPAAERKQDALKAAAKKWFPFGFGPKQGTSFMIEDMADHSDDEEIYGDFQYQRNELENEIAGGKPWKGTNWFDEYQLVRLTEKQVLLDS